MLVGEGEPGRQADARQHLDGLNDGEREGGAEHHPEDREEDFRPSRKTTPIGTITGIRRLLALLAVSVLALGAAACSTPGSQVRNQEGLAGTYTVNGTDPEGTEYSGTVVITATGEDDVYDIRWIVTEALLEGTGTVDGDHVSVDWHTAAEDGPQRRGTGSYTIDGDGNLVGRRTITSDGTVLEETIFQKA